MTKAEKKRDCGIEPPPRKLSPWVPFCFLARIGTLVFFGWFLACMGMFFTGEAFRRVDAEPALAFVSLLMPALGLGLLGYCLSTGLRNRRLLENGEIARGKVLDVKVFRGKAGQAVLKRVKYQFTALDGETYEASAFLSPHLIQDDTKHQMIFYDPRKPRWIFPYAALADYGIAPDTETGEFRVTSAVTYPYVIVVMAIHAFLFALLAAQVGVLFGVWTWEAFFI